MLANSGRRRVRAIDELRVQRAQLEVQLVVARVAAAAAVASEVSSRAALEATNQSTEDRDMAAQATAATVTTEQDSLATRLSQAEAEMEELRAAVATSNDTAKKATTTTTTEAAAWDAAQTAAQEKAALEVKVAEMEQDLVTTGSDLRTVNR
jgi:hypothetical protein